MTEAVDVTAQGESWYQATAIERDRRGALAYDVDADVCVVGAGLAGLTVARELARRGWSVVVLEADQIGDAASGRNCGFVLPGFGAPITAIMQRVGVARARAMWAQADLGRAYVRQTIAETNMPGVAPQEGWLRVAKFAPDLWLADEVKLLRETFGAAVQLWPTEQVRATLKSHLYFNAVHFAAGFHIHPLNYLHGLAAAAEQAGVRIFETTPALAIDPAGVRKRVATPAARVRATQIVLAGNIQLGGLMPRLSATLMPLTTFVGVTEPLGERLADTLAWRGCVSDGERADNHYRIVDGDRLLWSGGIRTWSANPRRFAKRLQADIRRTFPQLGPVTMAHVWSGTLGRTVHRMPQIGELSPGLWVASGFGGHGLNTTAMAGLLIAKAIAEADPAWRLFQPYELVWAGGAAGRTLTQLGYAGTRMRDRLRARLVHRPKLAPVPVAAPAAAEPSEQAPPLVANGPMPGDLSDAISAEVLPDEAVASPPGATASDTPPRRPRRRRRKKRTASAERPAMDETI
jgi:glycine/D-amino acid oxidase-like deaminating enzyme